MSDHRTPDAPITGAVLMAVAGGAGLGWLADDLRVFVLGSFLIVLAESLGWMRGRFDRPRAEGRRRAR